jgi:hypothetical protein
VQGVVYLPADRGPSHVRIIAIGSPGQNISCDATLPTIRGAATAGISTGFEAVAAFEEALFL